MGGEFSTIEAAIEAIARGEIIIVVDAEDRENEGDFICAAEKVTPEVVNFMITHGRGQLCMPILPEVCERLKLAPMVESNTSFLGTAYTVPVDHKSCRTGITAQERACTIRAIVDPTSVPGRLRPPRTSCSAGGQGGWSACGVRDTPRRPSTWRAWPAWLRRECICEILGEDGDRATRQHLFELAREYRLEIISIEELIRYRRVREKLVYRITEAQLPTQHGEFKLIFYGVKYEQQQPFVLVMGDPDKGPVPLVRLHSACFTGDVLASLRCDCGDQLDMALEMIASEGSGVLVYLPQEGRGIGLVEKIKAYALQDQGLDTVEANLALGYKADTRDYGVGIQLLKDLGLTKVRLLTNNPKKTDAFIYGGFDLQVVDQVPIHAANKRAQRPLLATKREKMGHKIPDTKSKSG